MSWWESEVADDRRDGCEMTIPRPNGGSDFMVDGGSQPVLAPGPVATNGVAAPTGRSSLLADGVLPWQSSLTDTNPVGATRPVDVEPVAVGVPPRVVVPPSVPIEAPRSSAHDGQDFEYASFWRRLSAVLIDGFIAIFLFLPISALAGLGIALAAGLRDEAITVVITLMVIADLGLGPVAYSLVGAARGQTLGKQLVGTRVCRMDGRRLGFWLALGRNVLNTLSTIALMIGWLAPLWSPKKQTWHDSMTGTVVIRDRESRLAGRSLVWGIVWSLIGCLIVGVPSAWIVKWADDAGAFDSRSGYDNVVDDCYIDDYYCDLGD